MIMDAKVMIERCKALRTKAESLRDEADELREQARETESRAEDAEQEIAELENELQERDALFDPEDAEKWGRDIAAALHGTDCRVLVHLLGGPWLSNGHFAWRVDSEPTGWRTVNGDSIGPEIEVPGLAIDLTGPVGAGKSSYCEYSDFQVAGAGLVRYADRYWKAIQSAGDTVTVTLPTLMLVAHRDGKPMAVAMRVKL
jgi:hypothetical protein